MILPWMNDELASNGRCVKDNFKAWFGQSLIVDENGHPEILYHGTRGKPFDTFTPNIRSREQLGFGIHFAYSRDFAARYAHDLEVARKGRDPHVFEVCLRAVKPLAAAVLVADGTPEFELAKKLAGRHLFVNKDEHGVGCAWMQNAIDSTSPSRAEKLIRDAGFDAVVYDGRIASLMPGGIGATVSARSRCVLVFEASQIKSAVDNSGLYLPDSNSIRDGGIALKEELEQEVVPGRRRQLRP